MLSQELHEAHPILRDCHAPNDDVLQELLTFIIPQECIPKLWKDLHEGLPKNEAFPKLSKFKKLEEFPSWTKSSMKQKLDTCNQYELNFFLKAPPLKSAAWEFGVPDKLSHFSGCYMFKGGEHPWESRKRSLQYEDDEYHNSLSNIYRYEGRYYVRPTDYTNMWAVPDDVNEKGWSIVVCSPNDPCPECAAELQRAEAEPAEAGPEPDAPSCCGCLPAWLRGQ